MPHGQDMAAISSSVSFNALIVKLAAIGDVAMALPRVDALKAQHGCRIAWLCGASTRPLLECVAAIDELIALPDASRASNE